MGIDEMKCNICGEDDKDCIKLLEKEICEECERDICEISINDIIKYDFYKSVIKKMWIDYIIAAN